MCLLHCSLLSRVRAACTRPRSQQPALFTKRLNHACGNIICRCASLTALKAQAACAMGATPYVCFTCGVQAITPLLFILLYKGHPCFCMKYNVCLLSRSTRPRLLSQSVAPSAKMTGSMWQRVGRGKRFAVQQLVWLPSGRACSGALNTKRSSKLL